MVSREQTQSLVEQVYASLKEDILSWRLKPGTDLQETNLAETFGVSRTPIREALRQLAFEGLVNVKPQRGAEVSDVLIRDVFEAYQIRELIEPVACRIAAELISDDELDELDELLNSYKPVERPSHDARIQYHAMDNEVHSRIIAATGNELMGRIVDDLRARTIRAMFLLPPGRSKHSREEHICIVSALRRRDPHSAERAMQKHLVRAKERLMQ